MVRRRTITLLAAALTLVPLAGAAARIPPNLKPFRGAYLTFPGKAFPLTHTGPAFPRVSCAPGTYGFCTGTIVLKTTGGRRIGRAPVAVGSNDNPSVQVNISAAGRRMVFRFRRLKVNVTIATHDTRGARRTTHGHIYLTPPR
jgi:hypothetical protein